MKKLLSVSLATFAFAAVAEYQPITVGVTTIMPSSQNVVIPVPYTTIGSTTPVSIHDLVKAANLPPNTMLYYFNGSSYYGWKNVSGTWSASDISATIGGITVSPGSGELTIGAGGALWLSFPGETTLNEQSIVVYGNPAAATNTVITAGTAAEPKSYLLCNPTASSVALSDKVSSLALVKGDRITPIGATFGGYYVYTGSSWTKVEAGTLTSNATLPTLTSYTGCWFVSKGGSGTINW